VGPPPGWRGFDAFAGEGPGKSYQLRGGWLTDDIRAFDPAPFGLNPREARDLDPQQRLLLRCTREAFDRGQVRPDELGRVGAWVGNSGSEYKVLAQRRGAGAISPYIGTGTHPATAAGRLAYTFGLEGPAVAVDTACSSGLVALHHAVQAIRRGEVDSAVVGAVNVLLDPEAHVSMAAMGTLSRTGACHSWSAQADGYVRSEGCVVLLLSRHDLPRWGTVRGSACNQDGRSSGLTAPRRQAQISLLREALDQAGVAPGEVAYHEGHGSATPLGDGVEIAGLSEVFGARGEGSPPVALGSVKARLGHLEAAAGLAGVLHALVVARDGVAPAMPHSQPPAPALHGVADRLVVPSSPRPLAGRIATVCAFGIGGTNAAAVLDVAPVVAAPVPRGPALVCLSGASEEALGLQREAVRERLEAGESAAALAAASQRGLHDRMRQAVWWSDDGAASWGKALQGSPVYRSERGHSLVFAAPGQGVGRPGLGATLARWSDGAAEVFDEVCAAADPLLGGSLRQRLWAGGDELLDDMPALQVGVFAESVAWARVLSGRGLEPEVVLGHSSGEWAAAVLAGVVDLADAVRVLVRRGQLLGRAGPGAMWAVFAPAAAVESIVAEHDRVGIAAENHEAEVVISGPPQATAAAAEALSGAGFEVRRLSVGVAGHSALLDPVYQELEEVVGSVTLQRPQCEFLSTATAEFVDRELTEPAYWARQFRQPVQLRQALTELDAEGLGPVVELGPHPMMARAARVTGLAAVCTGHREEAPGTSLAKGIGALWARGVEVGSPPPSPARKPVFAEVRRRMWLSGVSFAAPRWVRRWHERLPGAPRVRLQVLRPGPGGIEALIAAAQERLEAELEADEPCSVVACLDPDQVDHHGLAGWLRSVRWERPGWGVSIHWGPATDAELARVPAGEEVRWASEDERSWEAVRLQAAAVPGAAPGSASSVAQGPWRGHWVVTGGFGALGLHTARWLVQRGVERLTLVGRRGCPDHAREAVDALASRVTVDEVQADVAGVWPDALDAAVVAADGVIHGAGVLHDTAFWRSTPTDRARVFAAKVDGTRRLLQALEERPETWLVAYSSLTGAAGGAGQSSYGAANAWLDAALAERRADGGRALSVAWGPWQGEGLAAETLDRRAAQGLPPMEPEAALQALDDAIRGDEGWVAVAQLGPERMAAALVGQPQPLWGGVVGLPSSWRVQGGAWEEHRVGGATWVSAADQLVWAVQRAGSLRRLRWVAPLSVPSDGAQVRFADHQLVGPDGVSLHVEPGSDEVLGPWPDRPDDAVVVDLDALYTSFRERGVVHGPAYRRTLQAWRAGQRIGGRAAGGTTGQRLDSLLSLAATWAEGDQALVPASAESVIVEQGWEEVSRVVIERRDGHPLRADVVFADADATPRMRIVGMRWAAPGVGTAAAASAAVSGDAASAATTGAPARPWAAVAPDARRAWLSATVERACSEVLELDELVADLDLAEQGLDSIVALELRDRLRAEGVELPLHQVVGGATPDDLVEVALRSLPEPATSAAAAAGVAPGAEPERGTVPSPGDRGSSEPAPSNDWLQAWWWTPFFLGALVGATLWALIG